MVATLVAVGVEILAALRFSYRVRDARANVRIVRKKNP